MRWNYFEDDIWNILVNRFANSKLCINREFYIYNYNNDSLKYKNINLKEKCLKENYFIISKMSSYSSSYSLLSRRKRQNY